MAYGGRVPGGYRNRYRSGRLKHYPHGVKGADVAPVFPTRPLAPRQAWYRNAPSTELMERRRRARIGITAPTVLTFEQNNFRFRNDDGDLGTPP